MAASTQGKSVFLCHAGENKAFVRQLVDRLETDGLNKDRIFYDEISLQPGDELDNIIKVIESPSMKLFVFVVSTYCFKSNKRWIRAEWEAAIENNTQIFPIWLDDNDDGFKAFGNLVREFSYELRKVIAQRVNTQEISNSLPALSERICSLVCGDKSTQQRPAPFTDNSLAAPRQTILPETIENPTLEGLGLAITSSQDSSFSECAAHPVTRHLGQKMGQKSQQVTALEGRLEMAKQHAGIQETIVNSLHEEVTGLKKKDESLQKVLLNKTEEIQQLQATNRDLKSEIDYLRNAKSKHVITLEGRLGKATEKIKQLQETNGDLKKENEELRKLKWPISDPKEVPTLEEQTARLHRDSRNDTANDDATKLAWCKELASSILLDDDWFSFTIKQRLAADLDRIPPVPPKPTWWTFFAQFGLTKYELEAVNTRSVPSPTLALFELLQCRNSMERYTIRKVLESLHSLKLYNAASFLCDELLKDSLFS